MVTRMAVDELGLAAGRDVFALIKTVALDERGIATAGGAVMRSDPVRRTVSARIGARTGVPDEIEVQ